ncbi:MAG: glutathione peroxidase [Cyanobacteriota bacterium]|nr:glutathione peroxidase [Cyanobacteriota bacterium]
MLKNSEGQRIPDVTFRTRTDSDWVDISSKELFDGKTVIVFALPGAFTPTCSSTHLPGYNELAPVFKENGVDDIICLSVNDAFVMNEWGKNQKAENVKLIPDGNGDFSEQIGMLVDKADLGFGQRSWRYSMLVKDGVIDKMFIEPEVPGDPFEVSDAETMLNYINPNAAKPKAITMFSKVGCPYCMRAKSMLKDKGWDFEEVVLGDGISTRSIKAATGATSTPQIFIDGQLIGGSDELEQYLKSN